MNNLEIAYGLGVASAALMLTGLARYALQIWKYRKLPFGSPGKLEPQKVTWFIWVSLDTITFVGMWLTNTLNGQIIACMPGWILVGLGIAYGKKGLSKTEIFCAVGAILAVTLWSISNNPTIGIVISNGVILFGSIPVFVAGWQKPEGEDRIAWLILWGSCIPQCVGVWIKGDYSAAAITQPIIFLVINSIMMYLLFARPLWTAKPKQVVA